MNNKFDTFIDKIKNITNKKIIIEEKNIFSKEFFLPLYEELKKANNDEKKEIGLRINRLKQEFEELVENRLKEVDIELEKVNSKSKYDILLPLDYLKSGSLNPIEIVTNKVISFFQNFGFEIFYGEEIVSAKYNFENLNINLFHPARNTQDSFYINSDLLLRTHCTSVTAKVIENSKKEELKIISFGNVYRKDDDDATHSHQFNQLDMVWLKKDLSILNLKWIIDQFLKYFFEKDIETKYRISYFPFTEPSFEVDISCFNCHKKGCNICKHTGWIEILGAGMLHPNVIAMSGLNKEMTGMAFGVGIDRLTMLKFGIQDIREIYNNNFRLLEQFRGKW